MNGDQAYLLIADHITVKLWHVSYGSNKTTLNWLIRWLACHTPPNAQNKYVVMDQGGKMAQKPEIVSLFDKYGYAVRWTFPDASHQNYPDEGPHRYT